MQHAAQHRMSDRNQNVLLCERELLSAEEVRIHHALAPAREQFNAVN